MKLRNVRPGWMVTGFGVLLTGVLVFGSLVRAEGVPAMNTLVYTGRLVEDGTPVTGLHDIRLTLWSHPDSTDVTMHRLCRVVPPADVMVQDGYFRIPLDVDDDSCEVAIADHAEVWFEVQVDGTTLAPRTQIAAVPYALEANRASGAAGDLRRELDELVPAGTIISYGGEATSAAAPPGWILCDGRAVSSTDPQYARLFLAIRTAWGNGTDDADPATDFNLPDLRGRFVRGLDQGAGRDPEAAGRQQSTLGGNSGDAVGTMQAGAYASHNHGYSDPGHIHNPAVVGIPYRSGYLGSGNNHFGAGGGASFGTDGSSFPTARAGIGITISASGGAETRPINAAVNYLIRL